MIDTTLLNECIDVFILQLILSSTFTTRTECLQVTNYLFKTLKNKKFPSC